MKKNIIGFTLIEAMIVVAIIGLLAAFALPSYSNYIAKTRVSELINTCMAKAQKTQMDFYTEYGMDIFTASTNPAPANAVRLAFAQKAFSEIASACSGASAVARVTAVPAAWPQTLGVSNFAISGCTALNCAGINTLSYSLVQVQFANVSDATAHKPNKLLAGKQLTFGIKVKSDANGNFAGYEQICGERQTTISLPSSAYSGTLWASLYAPSSCN